MIDWVTAKLPCRNDLKTGCVAKLDSEGNVEWLSQSWLPVEGSYSSNFMIKSLTPDTIKYQVILLNGCKVIIYSVRMT